MKKRTELRVVMLILVIAAFMMTMHVKPVQAAADKKYQSEETGSAKYREKIGKYYYWVTSENNLKMSKKSAAKGKTLVKGIVSSGHNLISANGSFVYYWGEGSDGIGLYRVNIKSKKTKLCLTGIGEYPEAMHIYGNYLYFYNGEKTLKYNLETGKKQKLFSWKYQMLCACNQYIYFVKDQSIFIYNCKNNKMKRLTQYDTSMYIYNGKLYLAKDSGVLKTQILRYNLNGSGKKKITTVVNGIGKFKGGYFYYYGDAKWVTNGGIDTGHYETNGVWKVNLSTGKHIKTKLTGDAFGWL